MRNAIKNAILATAVVTLSGTACEPDEGDGIAEHAEGEHADANPLQGHWAERGRLVSYKKVQELSRRDIREAMFDLPFDDAYAAFGLDDFFDFYDDEQIDEVVRADVEVYQVVYETIDPEGMPTTASGAVLMPRAGRALQEDVALWCLMRGTVFYDADVPSHGEMPDWGIWRGLLPAAAGYVTAMPDYLGFGASRHLVHPYLVSQPTATAAIDIMRATRHLAAELGVSLRDEVFISGHSQGGHGTLATQRELEAHHAAEFDLRASAPASGPYASSGLFDALFNSETLIAPQVTAYYTLALIGVHDLGQPLSYYFEPPYDELVLDLYDKTKDNAQVIAGLPSGTTNELFADEFLTALRGDDAHQFQAAMALNDVHTGWTPRAPITLFYGTEDPLVVPAQSEAAQAGLAGDGVEISLEPIEGAGHLQTIVPSTLRTIHWFDGVLSDADDDHAE